MKNPFFLLSISLILFSCTSQPIPGTIASDIQQNKLKSILETTGATLVDIRTEDEISQGIIDGAKTVDYFSDDFMKQMEQFPQDQPIVLYCASGGRSAKAMKMLNNAGWKEVYNLLGGYREYVPN